VAVPVRLSQELRASVGTRHAGRQEDPVPAAADPQEGTWSEERTMSVQDYTALQADLHAAISKVINDHEDGPAYLMRFVVLAEIVDADGGRGLWQVAADGMMRWDTLGLLEHARDTERASTNLD
jgi:hypothetical protein